MYKHLLPEKNLAQADAFMLCIMLVAYYIFVAKGFQYMFTYQLECFGIF